QPPNLHPHLELKLPIAVYPPPCPAGEFPFPRRGSDSFGLGRSDPAGFLSRKGLNLLEVRLTQDCWSYAGRRRQSEGEESERTLPQNPLHPLHLRFPKESAN